MVSSILLTQVNGALIYMSYLSTVFTFTGFFCTLAFILVGSFS